MLTLSTLPRFFQHYFDAYSKLEQLGFLAHVFGSVHIRLLSTYLVHLLLSTKFYQEISE